MLQGRCNIKSLSMIDGTVNRVCPYQKIIKTSRLRRRKICNLLCNKLYCVLNSSK